ncbi:hypothetical protein ICHIJ1_04980 [Fluviibacter phosphoraccumulans]|uniref:Uncharacterized protein n=1 Tax=Fluviibacter phosphoraccumulans TaxID=1751046 RepID=A0A679I6B5_9RHOO|nr:hypothetical protein ICHIAU1_01650 [Fluviibacter phosphoraccumulans]BBU70579.1 hypothetical protein ICHIJ1_04980 [Fluviibacter phosphoraccumulans]BCA66070.1 hypothetical protein SHINM1_016720 [Fluviibacter phosphoraccumulans]
MRAGHKNHARTSLDKLQIYIDAKTLNRCPKSARKKRSADWLQEKTFTIVCNYFSKNSTGRSTEEDQ